MNWPAVEPLLRRARCAADRRGGGEPWRHRHFEASLS
jgi:hypothetical protein